MSKFKLFAASFVCVAVFAWANVVAAQDSGCGTSYFSQNVQPQMGYVSNFGYPTQTCNRGGLAAGAHAAFHQHMQDFKDHLRHTFEMAAKVEARNRAWPKPFACADRSLYAATFRPMLNAGIEDRTTLGNSHFNADNELNGLGKATISMIMTQMPKGQRNIFLERNLDDGVNVARMTTVKSVINTWYSTQSPQIAMSDRHINPASGLRYQILNESYNENTSPPVIPVATGTGSTGGGVGQ